MVPQALTTASSARLLDARQHPASASADGYDRLLVKIG
jgi:hypothetical protein